MVPTFSHDLPIPPSQPACSASFFRDSSPQPDTLPTNDSMAMIKLSSEPPATGLDFTFDQNGAVTLLFGPSEHAILAHGTFISHRSDYFKTALKKEWAEGQTHTIALADECPRIMSYYLTYTYTDKLPTNIFEPTSMSTFTENSDEYYELLAELYVLGERLLDSSIRAAVIKEIIRLVELADKDGTLYYPKKEAANIIYRGTTAGSPASLLMVDIHQTSGTMDWLDSTCEPTCCLMLRNASTRSLRSIQSLTSSASPLWR
jgi:hypothetical protein